MARTHDAPQDVPHELPVSRRERRAAQRMERPARRRPRRATPRPAWQSPMVLVTAAALVVGAVLVVVALPKGPDTGDRLQVPHGAYATNEVQGDTMGPATAPVTMLLYSDFQCPACRMFVTEQLHTLVNEFVAPGTLRIEAKDIAILGRGSRDESLELAAGARCAAEQDRYWTFHDLVFWNQGRENRGDHSGAFIARVADAAGLDAAEFNACLERPEARTAIRDQTAAALGAGISSTPTLVINGQPYVGVPHYEQLAMLIRQLAASPAASTAPATPATTAP